MMSLRSDLWEIYLHRNRVTAPKRPLYWVTPIYTTLVDVESLYLDVMVSEFRNEEVPLAFGVSPSV